RGPVLLAHELEARGAALDGDAAHVVKGERRRAAEIDAHERLLDPARALRGRLRPGARERRPRGRSRGRNACQKIASPHRITSRCAPIVVQRSAPRITTNPESRIPNPKSRQKSTM